MVEDWGGTIFAVRFGAFKSALERCTMGILCNKAY